MTLVSYAQNFEDVILWRALKHVDRGFYIDIGAQDPVVDSVSLAFYEKGWRGVHVEPIKKYAKKLRAARPDEVVIESAIGEGPGTIDFWEISNTGLSTGDRTIATEYKRERRQYRAVKVPCLPLFQLLDRYYDREIHWLKIDVEGMELKVLRSWKPSKVRPWIVVVESTKPNSPEPTFTDWESRLVTLGYEFVYFDGVNRFYVSYEHPGLKQYFGPGPNVFDGFVLSGHASAPFCARVNAEAASLREQAAIRADEAARLSKRVDELRTQITTQTETFARAVAVWESTHAALSHALAERDKTVERLAARAADLEVQHAALSHALAERDKTVERLAARAADLEVQHAALSHALAERDKTVERLEEDAAAVHSDHIARKAELEWQLAEQAAEVVRQHKVITELEARGLAATAREARLQEQLSVTQMQIAWLHQSTSWRLTAPLRIARRCLNCLVRGSWAWLTLRPGSRPRRVARSVCIGVASHLAGHRRITRLAKRLLTPFPRLATRLRATVQAEKARRHQNFLHQQPTHNVLRAPSPVDPCPELLALPRQADNAVRSLDTERSTFVALMAAAGGWDAGKRVTA